MRQDAAGARYRQRRGGTPVRAPGLDARGRDPRLCLAAQGRVLRHDGLLPGPRRLVPAPLAPKRMVLIRKSVEADLAAMLAIVNDAAQAYRGGIPADRWREPYMPAGGFGGEI